MSTLSVVATPQPSNVPPRVKVDITDTGTPAINSVTVTRRDANGRTAVVRTSDGNPQQLVTSGSNRVATLYDYEAPFGTPVSYSTSEQPANTSATLTVDVSDVWLIHVGVPARSMILDLRLGALDEEEFGVNSGVFYPMGRDNAVYITDGRRHAGASQLLAATDTLDQYRSLKALIADAGVLLLNVNPSLGMGQDAAYIGVLDVRAKRRSDIGSAPYRDFTMPFVTVDAPVGGSQATYTWADVQSRYATWQALMDANVAWAAVQTPTN